MKRPIVIVLFALLTAVAGYAQSFALIDMEYIMNHIPEYVAANKTLDALTENRQKEVEAAMQEVKTLFDAYQKSYNTLSDAQRKSQEEAIVSKEKVATDLQRKYFGADGELFVKKEELLSPIEDAVYEAVKSISLAKGYAAVLDRASAASIIFASPSIDISNEVLAKLGY